MYLDLEGILQLNYLAHMCRDYPRDQHKIQVGTVAYL